MRRSRWASVVPLLLVVLAGACSSSKGASGDDGDGAAVTTSTTAVAAVTTTTAPEPTTTTLPPRQPQSAPTKAAAAFVAAWKAGDRNAALAVADPSAVDALFAHPAVSVESRGCNAPLSGTADCAYGVGGRGLLVVTTRSGDGGWLVSAANYEA